MDIVGTIHWGRSDFPLKDGSFDFISKPEVAAQRLNAPIDLIESGAVPKRRLYSLLYADLVADPLQTVAGLYQYFAIEFTPEGRAAIEKYLAENPRDVRPAHRFYVGNTDLVRREREFFKRYQEYFGVPDE